MAGLDRFVAQGGQEGWTTYMVGLDAAGAFDSASLARLVETPRYYAAPKILCRFIGAWLTDRTFTKKMSAPGGTAMGAPCRPTRGVPEGGAPSPFPWVLHVNGVADGILGILRRKTRIPSREWRVIFQVFAGDISAAISQRIRGGAITLSRDLSEALLEVLAKLALEVAKPKRNNFLVEGNRRERQIEPTGEKDKSRAKKRKREETILYGAGIGRDSEPAEGNGGKGRRAAGHLGTQFQTARSSSGLRMGLQSTPG